MRYDSCYRRLKMRAKLSSTSLSIVNEMEKLVRHGTLREGVAL